MEGGEEKGFDAGAFSKWLVSGNTAFLFLTIKMEKILALPGWHVFSLCLQ